MCIRDSIERGGRRFAVRADAVSLAASPGSDAVAGTVTSCSFQGDRYEVLATVDGATWRFFCNQLLAVGDTVSLDLDESRLAPLD